MPASGVKVPASAGLSCCLSIDIEVSPQDKRIEALAGVCPETSRSVTWALETHGTNQIGQRITCFEGDEVVSVKDRSSVDEALAALDSLAEGVNFVVGHNIINFDIPHLEAAAPWLKLLQKPVVDTLWLNPLAFPAHPYHHLVKHYKDASIKRTQRNDPCLDARLALQVFKNQQRKLAKTQPEILAAWHWLTTTPYAASLYTTSP